MLHSAAHGAARRIVRSPCWAAPTLASALLCLACPIDDREVLTNPDPVTSGGEGGTSAASQAGAGGTDAGAAPLAGIDKLDLLFMIDNSGSMSDKQEVLRLTVPDLMSRLVNPACLDSAGNEHPAAPPGAECPAGQRRQFAPIGDIHVGIISSSLGDVGANVACPDANSPNYQPDTVDGAHLIGSLPRGQLSGATAQGFLEWRSGADLDQFSDTVQAMVGRVGENGCGWEASLESWYRFLVDPQPFRSLVRVPCEGSASTAANCVAPAASADGSPLVDAELLAQRAAFLRPDSHVVIVMLSDENDCSLIAGNQTWVVVAIDDTRPMFRGSSTCATDPNDKCCYTCPLAPPEGCAPDPACAESNPDAGVLPNRLPPSADGSSLRCFDHKRRFGLDFLFPIERYVNALSQAQLCPDHPDLGVTGCQVPLVQNPLFAGGRTADQVFLAGLVGVPWQALRAGTRADGQPLTDPDRQLRFKSSRELTSSDWDRIAGSPGTAWRAASPGRPEVPSSPAFPPSEPTMVESELERPNVGAGNPINGREYDTTHLVRGMPDDLQYACVFPLPAPRDCSSDDGCDCSPMRNGEPNSFDRPICESTPGNGSPGTTQFSAKAYPGLRQLHVLRALGLNAIPASICARNTSERERPDFGYRPAIDAILERLQTQLTSP